jgi:hypothetical protein
LEGELELIRTSGDVSEWNFVQPAGRRHDIKLKGGI